MNLLLFLGSGISLPSGVPGVQELTDSILTGEWYQHTDRRFYAGSSAPGLSNPVPVLQEFLGKLKPLADQCHPLDGQKGNYEDLYFLAEQISDDARSQVDNPAIHPFVRELKAQTEYLTRRSLGELSNLACDFMRCVVEQELARPPKMEGLTLIESLALSAEVQRVDILTLNHDLLVERFLKQRGIPFVDGFSDSDGDVRYFDPTVFESATKIRVFKLHGSIDWYRFRTEEGNPFSDRFGVISGPDAQHARNGEGELLNHVDLAPWILTGTNAKAANYGFGIYAEMHFWFHRLLKEHSFMAMSGYGWGDRGINGRLMEWLHSAQPRRLILMHEKPDELTYSKSPLWHRYDSLVSAGRIVPVQKWMQHVDFEDIRSHC